MSLREYLLERIKEHAKWVKFCSLNEHQSGIEIHEDHLKELEQALAKLDEAIEMIEKLPYPYMTREQALAILRGKQA